jgi:hypothetical protein
MSMTGSDTEFITIAQAAADFDDYFCGKYFVPAQESSVSSFKARLPAPNSVAQALLRSQPTEVNDHENPSVRLINQLLVNGTDSQLQLRDPSILPPWAIELRQMLNALQEHDLIPKQASPLHRLCECGSHYGLQRLKEQISAALLDLISQKVEARLNTDLRQTLARATRPCFALNLEAFRSASEAIWFHTQGTGLKTGEMRFAATPCEPLGPMFKTFPVLARLWSQLISQWCNHIAELLLRFTADRRSLSHAFFGGQRLGKIIDLRGALSDSHNGGRTVVLLQFESGSVIYKPRKGDGEWEWLSLLQWMNSHSFRPKLRAARVLRREGYCWMEHIRPGPCKDRDAARRFYRRVGGILGAAYLLEAVDCHRDNVIASGEYPVLIDAETLCHVARETKTQSLLDPLYETGFLPRAGQRPSRQYQSSVLGRTTSGQHAPRIAAKPLSAARYEIEIVDGFRGTWRCLLGTTSRRSAFVRRLQRLRRRERRWIYWSTRNYDAIRRASVQPAALRSGIERDLLIARSCMRSAVPESVVREEINALKRLDIPYFSRKTSAGRPLLRSNVPAEIVEAIRGALHL